MTQRLADDERLWLLALARRSIEAGLQKRELPAPDAVPAGCAEAGGCFVTLHDEAGALRGCIGTFSSSQPLWRNVQEMALAAATRDPRFSAVGLDELTRCSLEISALSRPEAARAEDVVVGRHGLQVQRGLRRGVLLPQVAVEHGWDRVTFLERTCLKAGLPVHAWRQPETEIHVFEAEVFGDGVTVC